MKKTLRTTAVLAALVLLTTAACGGGSSDSSEGSSPGELTFVSYGGAFQDAQSKAFVEPFVKNTGVKVSQSNPVELAKIKTMVDAGRVSWDVVDASPMFSIANCGTYAEKLDFDVIDVSKVDPALVSPCSVPETSQAYILVYNTDTFGDNPPTSSADFYDLKKFPGKRGVWGSANAGGLETALMADGVAPDDLYPLDVPRALKKLDTIKKQLTLYAGPTQLQQAIEDKEVAMAIVATGRGYEAVKNGAPYKQVWRNALLSYNGLMIPKGSMNKDQAMKFLAQAVSAESQALMTENIAYGPINSDAKPEIDDLKNGFLATSIDPAAEGAPMQDMKWWSENLDDVTKTWTAWTQS